MLTQAAATIYSAYIVSGQVGQDQEEKWRAKATREAVALATSIDREMVSDGEMG